MNKSLKVFTCILLSILIGGCAGGSGANNSEKGGIGGSVVASWLEGACHDYLDRQDIWQVAKLALAQQAIPVNEIERDVCQCASSAAAQNMTAEQKLSLLSPQSRKKVLLDMIAPAALSCYQKFDGRF